ncbi:uncharacterized protein Z518_08537 [Rhinocladiella mackenziei CBS 650.93]|uniref:ATPase inhibitor, mitochondrial n=1 Tax=Rhinocladiella mackenziei CBS 650.93 TaxID=1442369 RepID=A0A0D2IH25_9EURO|nr:uncharacterized protein Z518_08537 [Rhinocladiella mackenziei CBS 650.93]KIX02596.1 hypothetical protein Z518_08537 [Rhinocladiella mackenziei CBS 650.93]
MIRTTMPRAYTTRITTPAFCQSFVTSRPRFSEGDTGAVRSGGVAAGDSFIRREQAIENMYFKQHEMENIKKMREKLMAQRKHLDEVESHLNEMEKAAAAAQQGEK